MQLSAALERVRAGADIMPRKQLEKVLVGELGPNWRSKLADFEYEPLAAASIGQVCLRRKRLCSVHNSLQIISCRDGEMPGSGPTKICCMGCWWSEGQMWLAGAPGAAARWAQGGAEDPVPWRRTQH
jgi:hypothetical protein